MQNQHQPTSNAVSPEEAQQVLSAWSNQQQAQGVDPRVDSVQALAAGLGVTETQVRQMLEDIRVQHRSQEIAAGIIDEQQKQRKRSDVTAAAGAAIALVVIALLVAAFFMFGQRGSNSGLPPLPPRPTPVIVQEATQNVVNMVGPDGKVTVINDEGYHLVEPNGSAVVLTGDEALAAVRQQIASLMNENTSLRKKGELTKEQSDKLKQNQSDIEKLNRGLAILERAKESTPPPSAPGDATND